MPTAHFGCLEGGDRTLRWSLTYTLLGSLGSLLLLFVILNKALNPSEQRTIEKIRLGKLDQDIGINVTKADNCTLFNYHQQYNKLFSFSSNKSSNDDAVILDNKCLVALMDENPHDMTLQVGMVHHLHRNRAQQPTRHILYYCRNHCGGLGDRLRAMIYTFHLAWTLNATFGIFMEHPVKWDAYFSQDYTSSLLSQHGWLQDYLAQPDFSIKSKLKSIESLNYKVMPWSKLPMIPNTTAWISNTNMELTLFDTHQESVYLSGRTFPADLYVKLNTHIAAFIQRSRLKGLNRPKLAFIFSRLHLNRISPFLQQYVTPYATQLQAATSHIVGVQIRIGDAASGWGSDRRNTLASVDCFVQKTKERCRHQTTCVVWLTTDNDDAVRIFEQALFNDDSAIEVLRSKGLNTTHLDRSHFQSGVDLRLAHLKTFLDWYILAHYSDSFVISHSLYSEMATYYRMSNETHFRPVSRFESFTNGVCTFDDL